VGSVLDNAKAHYRAKLGAEPRVLVVPEWETTVYIKPAITLGQMGAILELTNSGKTAEAIALTAIYRLLDEDGKPIFKAVERSELMRSVDPDVLARIVGEINSDDPDYEDIQKN
jgi:Asp-tRNA(Asn)/Glu-tRNA(Gln) amidotransferase B subunit